MLESSYSSSALASADKASLLYVNPNSSKSSIYNNPSWKTTATPQPASKLGSGYLNINSGTTTTTTPKPIHTGPKSAQSKGSPFFFYESNSKLVPLKKFYENWGEQLGDGSIYSKKQGQKEAHHHRELRGFHTTHRPEDQIGHAPSPCCPVRGAE